MNSKIVNAICLFKRVPFVFVLSPLNLCVIFPSILRLEVSLIVSHILDKEECYTSHNHATCGVTPIAFAFGVSKILELWHYSKTNG